METNNKRKQLFNWQTKLTSPFAIIALSSMIIFTIGYGILILFSIKTFSIYTIIDQKSWLTIFLVFIIIQIWTNAIILFLIFNLLHKTTGAFPRIENNLDKVIAGDYSIRIGLRVKDNKEVVSLVNKINKILEILQNKPR